MTPRQWLRKNHYTRKWLARRLRMHRDTLREYLRCRRQWPLAKFYELVILSRNYVTLQDTVAEWEVRREQSKPPVAG